VPQIAYRTPGRFKLTYTLHLKGYARSSRLFTQLGQHDRAVALAQVALQKVKEEETQRQKDMQTLIDSAILAQYDHLQAQQAQQALKKDSECNISKLPFELLVFIFKYLIQEIGTSPVRLAHVCKQWKRIIWDSPSLWSILTVEGKKPVAKADLWATRSKNRLQDLRLISSTSLGEILETLKPSAICNLEKLEFDFLNSRSDNLPHMFRLKSNPRWLIWRAKLAGDQVMQRLPLEPIIVDDQPFAFRLSELEIFGVFIYWSLEVQQLENLTSFIVGESNLTLPDLLMLLQRSPSLEVLDVQVSKRPLGPTQRQRINLPNLVILKLSLSEGLLGYLEVPSLQVLQLKLVVLEPALQDLLPSSPPLSELRIQDCSRGRNTSIPLPNPLKYLALTASDIDTNVIVNEIAAGKCPNLTHLDLSTSCISDGPIIRLLKARNGDNIIQKQRDGEVQNSADNHKGQEKKSDSGEQSEQGKPQPNARIESLVMDRCDQITTQHLAWMRQKVPLVSCVYENKNTKRRKADHY
jgi:hypothetical protein